MISQNFNRSTRSWKVISCYALDYPQKETHIVMTTKFAIMAVAASFLRCNDGLTNLSYSVRPKYRIYVS